jgi:hypothetical protein
MRQTGLASTTSEDPDAAAERQAAALAAVVESEMARPINTAVPLQDLADSLLGNKKPQPTPAAPVIPPQASIPVPTGPKITPANPPAKTLDFGIKPLETHDSPVGNLQAAATAAASGDKTLVDQLKKTSTTTTGAPGQNSNLKPLRTYESDVAEVMAHTRMSSTSMIMAENKKKAEAATTPPATPTAAFTGPVGDYSKAPTATSVLAEARLIDQSERPHTGKNLFIIVLCLIFVAGGAIGGYYFWSQSPVAKVVQNNTPTATPATQTRAVPGIIPADTQTIISIDHLNAGDIRTRVQTELAATQSANTVKEIILSKTGAAGQIRVTAPDMATLMNTGAPDILTRTLTDAWMLGVYADKSGAKSLFVIVTTNFFQNAFAGVLQWESIMPDDLKQYLLAVPGADIANVPATSNASSTPPVTTSIRGQFQDRIVDNRDVRAFVTADGRTLFLYSFVDNAHLVVTSSDAALGEIITRLEKQTLVR